MPESTVQRTVRGISPILFVLAALCFLLPFAGVSCNAAALRAVADGTPTGMSPACAQALSGRDLVTYSGVDMLSGRDPTTSTTVPGCFRSAVSSPSTVRKGGLGVQPLAVAALVLIIVGVAAVAVRARLRSWVAGAAAVLAALLVIANNVSVHGVILDRLTPGGGSLAGLGASANAAGVFDIHAAIGFWLILAALLLAAAANAAEVALTARAADDMGAELIAPRAPDPPAPLPPQPPPA